MLGKPVCIRPLNIDTKGVYSTLQVGSAPHVSLWLPGDGSDSNIRWQVHQASILQAFLHITMREIVPLALKSKVPHGKGPPNNGLRVGPIQQAARTLGPQPYNNKELNSAINS